MSQRWLATDEDDGQIARVLVPADKSLKHKLSEKDSKSVRKEIALETKGRLIFLNKINIKLALAFKAMR